MTSELFIVSLLVLLLVLMVLLVLCWILRHSRNRNLTVLQISAGQPARVLTIRTEPEHAHQLLDHLLDRVFLQVEFDPESGEKLEEEPEENLEEERGSDSGSNPELSTEASLPRRAVKALQNNLWKWMTVVVPPAATPPSPPPPPPPPPPASQDETDDLDPQCSAASQHAPLSSRGASCGASGEEKHNESHL